MLSILSNDLQRFGTFAAYPESCPLYFTRLSSAGFSYTGKDDFVTCTACKVEIGNWNEKDIPLTVHQQHSPECPLVLEILRKNAHVTKTAKLQDRIESCESKKQCNQGQLQNGLSEIIPFDTSDDSTSLQSSDSTDNGWGSDSTDNGWGSDSTDSGWGSGGMDIDGFERENSVGSGFVSHPSESGSFLLQSPSLIPYKKPRYPEKSILCERLQTFRKLPRRFKQSPENLARAGFFYTGVDDLVRCFHCGGGLTCWEPEDNPWVEHAHWFPKCTFLRQNKGDEFIAIVQSMVEQLKHETEHQQVKNSAASTRNHQVNSVTGNGASGATGNAHDMAHLSRQATDNDTNRDIKDIIAVRCVLEMGYNLDVIVPAYHSIVDEQKTDKISAVQLMSKVFEIEEQQIVKDTNTNHKQATKTCPISAKTDTNAKESHSQVLESNAPDKTAAVMTNHAELATEANSTICSQQETSTGICNDLANAKFSDEDILLCKVCMEEQVCIVFLPCGHLATCGQCAPAMKKCPICRMHVRGSVKTYLS